MLSETTGRKFGTYDILGEANVFSCFCGGEAVYLGVVLTNYYGGSIICSKEFTYAGVYVPRGRV